MGASLSRDGPRKGASWRYRQLVKRVGRMAKRPLPSRPCRRWMSHDSCASFRCAPPRSCGCLARAPLAPPASRRLGTSSGISSTSSIARRRSSRSPRSPISAIWWSRGRYKNTSTVWDHSRQRAQRTSTPPISRPPIRPRVTADSIWTGSSRRRSLRSAIGRSPC